MPPVVTAGYPESMLFVGKGAISWEQGNKMTEEQVICLTAEWPPAGDENRKGVVL